MEEEIIKLIANYGVVGLLFYVAIKDFFAYLSKKKTDEKEKSPAHPLCHKVIELSALFESSNKMQAEKDAIIHNGLNSNANAIKDLSKALADNTTSIAVLNATINERLPKKQ